MLVEQGNVTALLERVEQVGEPEKLGQTAVAEKLRKGGFLIWTIPSQRSKSILDSLSE